jgi:hypothetical protein
MPELRFNLGYGYLRLRIATKADAIRILILLRGCKSGLYYDQNDDIIWAKTLKHYSDINKILKQEGYCDSRSS